MSTLKTVVVIGGGITGLTTMHYLQKLKREHNLDIQLKLIEKNEQLGGKIKTLRDDGFIIEAGADSMVARHKSVMPLVQDLQLEDQLVYNATGISYIYTNDELHPIPADTIFGIPTSVESLYTSSLVSEKGKQAALKDLESKNEMFTKESSIGSFLEHFLGKELVEKQVAPVLSGVYSGNIYELTLASTLPYLLDYKNKFGSIIKGLEENKKQFQGASDKKFISFDTGLSAIIDKLEEQLTDCSILKGVATTGVHKENESYQLTFSNHEPIEADFVVLSTPHDVTQLILNHDQLDDVFNEFKNSSLISIYLGFDIPDEELPADGTGFIVSENGNLNCNACTWTSRKWEHTSTHHHLLIRLFYKSSSEVFPSLKQMTEEELVEVALADIQKSLNLQGKPKTVQVTNWDDLMPNYHLNHSQAVQSLTENMSDLYPNVILAGCSYYGVGIGACIKNGEDTAKEIVNRLIQ